MAGDPEIVDYSSGYEWRKSTKLGENWLKASNAKAEEKPKEGVAPAAAEKKATPAAEEKK